MGERMAVLAFFAQWRRKIRGPTSPIGNAIVLWRWAAEVLRPRMSLLCFARVMLCHPTGALSRLRQQLEWPSWRKLSWSRDILCPLSLTLIRWPPLFALLSGSRKAWC